MTTDPSLIARLMYAVDNRVQLWFRYLRRATDREDINDSIINFTSIINKVVLDQFHLVLPPTFTISKAKTSKMEEQQLTKKQKRDNKKLKRDNKNTTPKDGDARKVVNKKVPIEFCLLEKEDYKKNFAHNNIEHRPKWNEDSQMCPRWWTHGTCYKYCRNAASHVASSELSADCKAAFIEYLETARRG